MMPRGQATRSIPRPPERARHTPVRYIVVGLGNLGARRREILGEGCVATVDPLNQAADFASVGDCPSDTFDAAVLSVPNEAKRALVRELMAGGKHVLVDKPLLMSPGEIDDVERVGRDTGAVCHTSYNHRHEPSVSLLANRLRDGAIGAIYHCRMVYANGTVRNVRGSWRDRGLGVVEDLGCHLVDLAGHLLDERGTPFEPWSIQRHEANAPDHAILASRDGRIVLEMSFLSWLNTFSIDVTGELGSLHVQGLQKWRGSEFIERTRVFPSGAPGEVRRRFEGPDETWQADFVAFERACQRGESSFVNDRWISSILYRMSEVAA